MKKTVFYIYAPALVNWSAGIRVLHELCNILNKNGFDALIALHGEVRTDFSPTTSNNPVVTQQLLEEHQRQGKVIVAIYPESIVGNPLNARYVIRWLLNFPKLLGGKAEFKNETVLAYSQTLATDYAAKVGQEIDVLFVPAILEEEIRRYSYEPVVKDSNLNLVYAQKFRALGGKPNLDYENVLEITRFGKRAPSRDETLRLIHESQVVHVYENTTVISEACLLGTPVICHRNRYFDSLIAEDELNFSGISWDENEIAQPDIEKNFRLLEIASLKSETELVRIFSSLKLVNSGALDLIRIPKNGIITTHSVSRALKILTQKGPFVFFRFLWNYIAR